ncbi:hypothetical protein S1361_30080 [Streptomyces cyanogenus]|uniref:Uncharacterized protein n=1 Tax=Streptomyces cyanogenus TaxID=80860 RepID=A0ABX7TXX0_STRCY|nr:hypothetical protein S1361_30080 [Streptomyces cyanogenus]
MQGSRWVFSELRPRGNMTDRRRNRRKKSLHNSLNATANTLDSTGHLATYWFLRPVVDNVVLVGRRRGNP